MRQARRTAAIAALCAAAVLSVVPARATDLSGAAGWLNVAPSFSAASLRGKIVALDFADDHSTAGRLSTRQMRALAAKLPAGFAAVGVRSPLGRTVEARDALRLDAMRRDVDFPVVDDSSGAIAAAFGVRTAPVVVLLDADGAEAGRYEGTDHVADIAVRAKTLLDAARAKGALNVSPLPLALERDSLPESPLMFPTQLHYDAGLGRLFVADTGHHRVVALTPSGRSKLVIGTGAPLFFDGPLVEAGFDHPEGLATSGSDLFVADTDDGIVRRVYLDKRFVITYASGPSLRQPRGLAVSAGALYIADAGNHVVDGVSLGGGHFFRFAGTGEPGRKDGLLATARLEEPAAIAALGNTLWIADATAGSLRSLSFDAPALATPALIGPGAPLSRPEGLAALGERLLVADSGDGRVKELDPKTGRLTVFADGLLQPSGVAVVGGEVIVSDTGRSRLLRYSADGQPLGELRLKGLAALPPGPPLTDLPARAEAEVPPQAVRSGANDGLILRFELPRGYHLNPKAPVVYHVSETRGRIRLVEATRKGVIFSPRKPIELGFTTEGERTEIILNVDFYYCRADDKGPCLAASKRYRVVLMGAPKQKQRQATVTIAP